jgi:hypothetical protein
MIKIPPMYLVEDVVVIWGGTRDIGRNEVKKALQQIRKFVQNHNQTNVIVMSAPYRHDLDSDSCVNKEVTVYNRKLKKHLKVFDNTQIVEVDSLRELYTRHGLHMNQNGKELMTKKTVLAVKSMLQKKKSDPIVMFEKAHADVPATDSEIEIIPKHDTVEPSNIQTDTVEPSNIQTDTVEHSNIQTDTVEPSNIQTDTVEPSNIQTDTVEPSNIQTTTSNNDTPAIRSSTRLKRPPNTMSSDFLW